MPKTLTLSENDALGIGIDRRRQVQRQLAETLADRAKRLPKPDRLLVEAVFRDGLSVVDVWDMGLVSHQRVCSRSDRPAGDDTLHPSDDQDPARQRRVGIRRLRRHLKRLVERLASPRFVCVERFGQSWPTTRRRVAQACVIEGLSIRQAARTLNLSIHTVRKQLQTIDAAVSLTQHAVNASWRQTHNQPSHFAGGSR